MKKLIRKASGVAGRILPFSCTRLAARHYHLFPFYHIVTDGPAPHTEHLYPVCTLQRFNNDIDFLTSNYRRLSFEQVKEYASRGWQKGEKPGFYLTFDDGLREIAEVVAPVLLEKGIEAAFFVNPAFVDNRSLFHRHKISLLHSRLCRQTNNMAIREAAAILNCKPENLRETLNTTGEERSGEIDHVAEVLGISFDHFLKEKKPYLTLEQIKILQEKGFKIGSHGYTHPLFSALDENGMKEQVVKSMQWLHQNLSPGERIFAFPFTDHQVPAGFFRWMYEEAGIGLSFGTAGLKHEQFRKHLQRIPMEQEGYHSVREILGEEYFYSYIRFIFGKNRITGR